MNADGPFFQDGRKAVSVKDQRYGRESTSQLAKWLLQHTADLFKEALSGKGFCDVAGKS